MKIETRNNKTIVSDIPDSWFEDYSAPKRCLFFWDLDAPLQTIFARNLNWVIFTIWFLFIPFISERIEWGTAASSVVFLSWLPWFLFLLIAKPGMEREKRFRKQIQAEL